MVFFDELDLFLEIHLEKLGVSSDIAKGALRMKLEKPALDPKDLWLVIPTATRHQFLQDIFENSLIPKGQIILVRTSPGPIIDKVHNIFVKSKKINIQKWWNLGINFAERRGAKFVAVLNDDVWIAPGSLQNMATEALVQNVPLVFPHPHTGQLAGYCWVLNLNFNVRPDNRFKWWYGDNDLQMQSQKVNKYIYVSAEVNHLESGGLTKESPILQKFADIDHYKFIQKWGDNQQRHEVRLWRYHNLRTRIKNAFLRIIKVLKFKD